MKQDREYVVKKHAVYPVDFESTGVIEINKKWGDGLQQFLEMKHCLPISPLSLITNFVSNVNFFDLYRNKDVCNILGVSGTLGKRTEKKVMREIFSVECAIIPTFKRRKLFELDGLIFEDKDKWLDRMIKTVEFVVATQRAVLVICEDIATAYNMYKELESNKVLAKFYSHYNDDDCDDRTRRKLEPGDVVIIGDVIITTNIGARGTDLKTDVNVDENGGLFVLVTFIPLNDRVERQAFGRTGRGGKTGSCQIIVNRKEMPNWLRLCETVDEAKLLRNYVNDHRLQILNEVKLMRDKQVLFDEYCKIKNTFVNLNNNPDDSDDVNIQKEILDETWAKWIQEWETNDQKSNNEDTLIQDLKELSQVIKTCSEEEEHFVCDNIYHLLKFGAVKMMHEDYKKANECFDKVIKQDRNWSAFAYYNRAYCTIQMKGGDNIQRAIGDLKEARCKFEILERMTLFSGIHGYASAVEKPTPGVRS